MEGLVQEVLAQQQLQLQQQPESSRQESGSLPGSSNGQVAHVSAAETAEDFEDAAIKLIESSGSKRPVQASKYRAKKKGKKGQQA